LLHVVETTTQIKNVGAVEGAACGAKDVVEAEATLVGVPGPQGRCDE
jgi:hypothetical protein